MPALKLLQAEPTADVDKYSPHLYLMEIVLWGMENEIVIATNEQDQQRLRALVEELTLEHPLVQMGYLMNQSYKNEDEMQEDEEYIMSLHNIDDVAEQITEDLIGILG